MKAPTTIAQLLRQRCEASEGPALWFRDGDDETFTAWTWPQLGEHCARTAAALQRLNVGPGDRVAHWAANCRQWVQVDLALHLLGAVHVPIHAPLTAAQAAQQAEHCGAKVMIVQHPQQAAELDGRWQAEHRLVYDGEAPGWSALTELADQVTSEQAEAVWSEAAAHASAEATATILYTSGTTGEPKGVVLTQGNLVSNSSTMHGVFPYDPDALRLCLLPLSHVFARTCDLYIWLFSGCQMGLAKARETVVADCQQLRPTSLNGVPYFFQRIRQAIESGADARGLFGGRIKYCCSGGAPLPVETYDFFHKQGIPIYQGYGLTETSPVISAGTPDADRRGAVGRPIPGTEVRITADGEVQARGPHIMSGYYRDPAATAAVMDGGWLRTGDLGRLDEDGYLFITGRRKELIVTSGGKNIAPVLLESLLTSDPLIEQAMVIGEGRSHLTALIVPDRAALAAAEEGGSPPETLIAAAIEKRLADVSHHEQVRKFALLPREFSMEQGELTPKLSLRRERIAENWQAEIESLYAK